MSKKKTQAKAKPEQPAYVAELLEKGTVIISAAKRDELGEIINTIPASCRYAAGAIGKNNTSGLFTLRLDLVK